MRLDPCTFDGHGPILVEPLRQIRNNISYVWLSPLLFEFKQNLQITKQLSKIIHR